MRAFILPTNIAHDFDSVRIDSKSATASLYHNNLLQNTTNETCLTLTQSLQCITGWCPGTWYLAVILIPASSEQHSKDWVKELGITNSWASMKWLPEATLVTSWSNTTIKRLDWKSLPCLEFLNEIEVGGFLVELLRNSQNITDCSRRKKRMRFQCLLMVPWTKLLQRSVFVCCVFEHSHPRYDMKEKECTESIFFEPCCWHV